MRFILMVWVEVKAKCLDADFHRNKGLGGRNEMQPGCRVRGLEKSAMIFLTKMPLPTCKKWMPVSLSPASPERIPPQNRIPALSRASTPLRSKDHPRGGNRERDAADGAPRQCCLDPAKAVSTPPPHGATAQGSGRDAWSIFGKSVAAFKAPSSEF
jgi:hypothetical protein